MKIEILAYVPEYHEHSFTVELNESHHPDYPDADVEMLIHHYDDDGGGMHYAESACVCGSEFEAEHGVKLPVTVWDGLRAFDAAR